MKILIVHNEYGIFSGEEAVVRDIQQVLELHGHTVVSYFRSSMEIPQMTFGKIRAFFCGIYNPWAAKRLRQLIEVNRPDVVHIHNLFPFISPAVLVACKQARVPVMMTIHNYRLICPNGLFLSHGEICEKCSDGREYWCVLLNCLESLPKSIGYALRNWFARKCRFYLDNVMVFATLTEFQRKRLIQEGYPLKRTVVIPNMVAATVKTLSQNGTYVGFAGRISREKGLPTLMEAAAKLPYILFWAAGSFESMPELPAKVSGNFLFLGHLSKVAIEDFYADCRIVVLPSICFEGFPVVLAEAMLRGIPVICSRIGGLPEIVEDRVTGLLFEPGNSQDLADKIKYLWERPFLCQQMGKAGREKVLREYSPDCYYERLMAAYDKARTLVA